MNFYDPDGEFIETHQVEDGDTVAFEGDVNQWNNGPYLFRGWDIGSAKIHEGIVDFFDFSLGRSGLSNFGFLSDYSIHESLELFAHVCAEGHGGDNGY